MSDHDVEQANGYSGETAPSTYTYVAEQRNQTSRRKLEKDHNMGKLLEAAAFQIFKPYCSKYEAPDYSLHKKKHFGLDLRAEGVSLHCKSTSADTCFRVGVPAWPIEHNDSSIRSCNPNEYLVLGVVNGRHVAILGCPSCRHLDKALPYRRPENRDLVTKDVVWNEDLQKLSTPDRFELLLKLGCYSLLDRRS